MAYAEPAQLVTNLAANPGTIPFLDNQVDFANHTMVVVAGAGVTAGSVQLQGSLDSISWFNLGTAQATTAAGTTATFVTGAACRYLRVSIATGITGGTISASVGSA